METILRVTREHAFDYPIVWAADFASLAGHIADLHLSCAKVCVVTDSHVEKLYAESLLSALPEDIHADLFVFPAGEEQKNLDTVNELYYFLIEKKYSRKDILVALGGGVVGDLTGYAAATYLRGIDFIQVPTTLLAQVDSSVGGKTGVDFRQFKNMIGAFHQPRMVYMNMSTLSTLDDVLFSCGMGEVLKTGLIRNAALYRWLDEQRSAIMERRPETLAYMIRECCKVKSGVVERDPKEQGERAILNLGHTIGHAVEKLKDFSLPHGHCVGVGTVAAAWLSVQRGLLEQKDLAWIEEMNRIYGLPNRVEELSAEKVLEATKLDKKAANGRVRFILLDRIGNAVIDDTVTDEEILAAIRYIGDRDSSACAGTRRK
ncbi:MAG: 3-dehydroquinate synthase [Lachnospiraceae bacterium]|nr:3-dehydroquinate synthase [Lachnospiraceae bacterium]